MILHQFIQILVFVVIQCAHGHHWICARQQNTPPNFLENVPSHCHHHYYMNIMFIFIWMEWICILLMLEHVFKCGCGSHVRNFEQKNLCGKTRVNGPCTSSYLQCPALRFPIQMQNSWLDTHTHPLTCALAHTMSGGNESTKCYHDNNNNYAMKEKRTLLMIVWCWERSNSDRGASSQYDCWTAWQWHLPEKEPIGWNKIVRREMKMRKKTAEMADKH